MTKNAQAIEAFVRTLALVQEAETNNTRSAGVDYSARCLLRDHGPVLQSMMDGRCLSLVNRIAALNPDAGEIGPGMLTQLVADARAIVGEPT